MKRFTTLFFLVFLAFGAARAVAQPLMFPLVCDAGQGCFIIGYPDMDKMPDAARDYACGPAASEGDPFLRIGLPDVATLTLGLFAVAADAGRVIDATDGLPDTVASTKSQIRKGTSVCGNGVVIDHGQGMTTAYCHLKRGSIKVKTGDIVEKGTVIGAAGQSGVALWPQLGFSIQKNGFYIDPITGGSPAEGCGFKPRNIVELPEAFKTYQPAAIVNLGFSIGPQISQNVALGKAERFAQIAPSSATINLWGMVLGLKAGDKIKTALADGRGRIFHQQTLVMDKDKDRQLINFSRQRGYAYWRAGTYSGEVVVTRTVNAKEYVIRRSVTVLVE
ncbi:MAG: M23 family metallopeptidase [Proteobacteria bacterium]|nr:M23 family metallopeptidase [Pseudomonadota bacterium]